MGFVNLIQLNDETNLEYSNDHEENQESIIDDN
jgi:hypothetical protein